jgi:hypothetical protein
VRQSSPSLGPHILKVTFPLAVARAHKTVLRWVVSPAATTIPSGVMLSSSAQAGCAQTWYIVITNTKQMVSLPITEKIEFNPTLSLFDE